MSVPYHKNIFSNEDVKLMINFGNMEDDVTDEDITLHFYAFDNECNPIFTAELSIEEIRELYSHLNSISVIRDEAQESSTFIETTDKIDFILEKLEEKDLDTLLTLLENFESEEKIKGLLNSLSDLEIENLHGAYHHKLVQKEINNLEELLELERNKNIVNSINSIDKFDKYEAGQPEKIFQNWIEQNLWIFGVEYIQQYDARKIALFSEGDLLMESVDGYLDLIELKRPNHSVLKYDNSHNCYYPHPDLSKVIGQCLFYLQKLEEYKLNLENEYEVKVIMPRIKIIVGRSDEFGENQNKCIRMLNTKLDSIEIITYDDLISYGKLLLKNNETAIEK